MQLPVGGVNHMYKKSNQDRGNNPEEQSACAKTNIEANEVGRGWHSQFIPLTIPHTHTHKNANAHTHTHTHTCTHAHTHTHTHTHPHTHTHTHIHTHIHIHTRVHHTKHSRTCACRVVTCPGAQGCQDTTENTPRHMNNKRKPGSGLCEHDYGRWCETKKQLEGDEYLSNGSIYCALGCSHVRVLLCNQSEAAGAPTHPHTHTSINHSITHSITHNTPHPHPYTHNHSITHNTPPHIHTHTHHMDTENRTADMTLTVHTRHVDHSVNLHLHPQPSSTSGRLPYLCIAAWCSLLSRAAVACWSAAALLITSCTTSAVRSFSAINCSSNTAGQQLAVQHVIDNATRCSEEPSGCQKEERGQRVPTLTITHTHTSAPHRESAAALAALDAAATASVTAELCSVRRRSSVALYQCWLCRTTLSTAESHWESA